MWKKFLKIVQKHDKYAHATVSCILILILALGLNLDIILAGFIALCFGIAKEWRDYFRGGYGDAGDLVADVTGIAIGALILLLV